MKKILGALAIMMLIFSLAFAGSGNHELKLKKETGRQGISADAWGKLVGPLKEAVRLYKKNPKIVVLKRSQLKRFKVKRPSINKGETRMDFGVEEQVLQDGLRTSIINPVIQKRWGNPAYDVLNCLVKIRGDHNALKAFNAKVRSVSDLGDYKIVNVEIASTDIEKIAGLSAVEKISPVVNKKFDNDNGSYSSGASRVRLKNGGVWKKGYTGAGVVVGVIDSGIDWTHSDFIDPVTGETRILYLWDTANDTAGQTPADVFGGNLAGLDYGTVWTKADIDAGLCTATDVNGHGTHVAGSAAGNGGASGRYTGMAPNADLVIVRGLDNNGNLFVFEMADMMGKPCSVNMSYGPGSPLNYVAYWPDAFPADGTSLDSLWYEGLFGAYGPGHICNKSAGNSGNWNSYTNTDYRPVTVGGHHSSASLSAASTHTLMLPDYNQWWLDTYGYSPYSLDYLFINVGMWYESPVQVSFISPNGNILGPMVHGTSGTVADYNNGDAVIHYDLTYGVQANGAYPAYFDFGDYFGIRYYPLPGEWQILVEPIDGGTGIVDMWAGETNIYLGTDWYWVDPILCYFTNADRDVVHSNYSIDESNSPWLLSVGGYTAKTHWDSIDGNTYHWTVGYIFNDVYNYSSPGPSRDRRMKPDIAAPGQTVMSSMSNFAGVPADYAIGPDGQHRLMSGTSMAAPHVTGAVALILEKHDHLSVSQVKAMLASYASHDKHTMYRGPNAFGYGKLNIKQLNELPVAMVTAAMQGDGTIQFSGCGSYDPEEFRLLYEFEFEAQAVDGTSTVDFDGTVADCIGTVTPDASVDAYYRVRFRVNDGLVNSAWVYSDWVLVQH